MVLWQRLLSSVAVHRPALHSRHARRTASRSALWYRYSDCFRFDNHRFGLYSDRRPRPRDCYCWRSLLLPWQAVLPYCPSSVLLVAQLFRRRSTVPERRRPRRDQHFCNVFAGSATPVEDVSQEPLMSSTRSSDHGPLSKVTLRRFLAAVLDGHRRCDLTLTGLAKQTRFERPACFYVVIALEGCLRVYDAFWYSIGASLR